MRRSVPILALCFLLGAAACPPKPDARHMNATPSEAVSAPAVSDKRTDTLDGVRITDQKDGPWAMRVALRKDGPWNESDTLSAESKGGIAHELERELPMPLPGAPMADAMSEPEAATSSAAAPPTRMAPKKRAMPSALPHEGSPLGASAGAHGDFAVMPSQLPPQGRLRAGSTDDNHEFDAFLKYLAPFAEREDTRERIYALDVRERRTIDVVDSNGNPLPGAWVDIVDANNEKPLWSGTTYGDGRLPFFPLIRDPKHASEEWLVNVRHGDDNRHVVWKKDAPTLRVVLDRSPQHALEKVPLDVLFLVDTTGSMSDEIQRIKDTLAAVTQKARNHTRAIDLRYGAVLYRDVGDEYVTSTHPFTTDVAAFEQALRSVQANGGGDAPESLNQGLAESIHGVQWRSQAAKVVFLIADAPPHLDYPEDVPYWDSAMDAVARGIRIHAVAASGLDALGTLCFRQIAQFSRGKFIFIEYGSVSAAAAFHGVTGEVKSNNLDDIIYEQIAWEIDHYGVPPAQG